MARAPGSPAGSRLPAGASRFLTEQLPLWAFVAFAVVTGPLILFHYGSYHWFLRDDWSFLADRKGFPPLLEPNGGAHWVLIPRLVYLVLWRLFGVTTYKPYQLCVIAVHVATAVLLRVVMRRAGVGPWLASAAAAILLLFGPGAQDIVWAFQIGFTGSIAYGLAHLLLADHEGDLDRRDLLGLAFGLAAILSSAIGVTTTVAVVLAVLLRRGWKAAVAHGLPLGIIYGAWALHEHALDSTFGRPTVAQLGRWVRSSVFNTFDGLGHFQPVALLFVALLVGGTVLALVPSEDGGWRARLARLSMPLSLAVADLFFVVTTGYGRWWSGDLGARASRYTYLEAALLLPLLAVAAQALARRWRVLTPVLVAVLLLPIPFNAAGFTPNGLAFGKAYMDQRRYVLTTAVRMPFAHDVPRDVQPVPDPYSSNAVTIGFLLDAAAKGRLDPSTMPLKPKIVNEFRVRLGVSQTLGRRAPKACSTITSPVDLAPKKGKSFGIIGQVAITTVAKKRPTSPPVVFNPNLSGDTLTIELSGLHLRLRPAMGAPSFQLCRRP